MHTASALPNPGCPAPSPCLIKKLKSGDNAAYLTIHRTYGPSMFAVARQFLGCPEDAQDCVQEAMIKAFRKMHRFEDRGPLGGWLRRITINTALMKIRARRSRPEAYQDRQHQPGDVALDTVFAERRTPEHAVVQAETTSQIRQAIARLPEKHQRILILRDIEGHSTAEAAASLGVSENTAKVRLHRARAALKDLLSEPVERN